MHTGVHTNVDSLLGLEKGVAMSVGAMLEEKVYTVKEVAALLRVQPRTVRRMIADGELPAFKVRDEYRIREQDIKALMQQTGRQEEEQP